MHIKGGQTNLVVHIDLKMAFPSTLSEQLSHLSYENASPFYFVVSFD